MLRARFVLLSLLAASCGSEPAPPDAGDDARATCETAPEAIAIGDPDGHAEPLGAGTGEARAGRIEESELPVDRTGLATWEAGDIVLANDRVAVIVETSARSDLFSPWGGGIVGIARVEGGALVEAADFEEIIPGLGLYTVAAESVTVIDDGSAGGPARVRALGVGRIIPFLADIAGGVVSGDFDGLPIAIDYVLAPGSEVLELELVATVDRPIPRVVTRPLQVILQASRMPTYVPENGFDAAARVATPFLAFDDPGATSFAYASADGDISRLISAGGADLFLSERFTLPACATTSRPFARITIGGPGIDGLRRAIARDRGRAIREVDVLVTDPGGAPRTGVRVHATRGTEHLTRGVTGDDGHVVLEVGEGEVTLEATRAGRRAAAPVTTSAASATIALDPTGIVRVHARDLATGEPVPARIQVIPVSPPPAVPASYGEPAEQGGRLHVAFEIDGEAELEVPVGTHRVVASRGYEHELADTMVDVEAGAVLEVDAVIEHVVDTPGLLSADFHIHTNRSPDAPDDGALKVRSAIADGLEVPVRSDHEWVNDFEPTIAALGAEELAFGVSSIELTTFSWGHFGVFPLDEDPSMPSGGAFEWAFRTPSEVFDDVDARRGRDGAAAMIVNHPREGGAAGSAFAYFDEVGLDGTTLVAARPELWDDRFSVIEVFNDSDFDRNEPETVRDWFSFLRAGRRMFAVGSSDSHGIASGPVGYPRTYVRAGASTPAELRALGAGALRDAVLAGHMTISGGIVVEAQVGASGPGDEATVGPRASLDVRVRAPTWIDADRLRAYVDGALVLDEPLEGTGLVRFDDVIEVDVAASGSWVVVVASGDAPLEPVHPGRRPFGVTNPIFLRR